MSYGTYLAHHGVVGMKWGHRKAMTNTGSASKSKDFKGQGGGGEEPLEEETAEDIKSDIEELIREGVADEILYSVLKGKAVDTDAVNEALQKAAEKVPKLAKAAAKEKIQKAIDNAKAKIQNTNKESEKKRNHKRLEKAINKATKSLDRHKKKKNHVKVSFHDAKIANAGHAGKDVKHSDILAYQNYLSHHGLGV